MLTYGYEAIGGWLGESTTSVRKYLKYSRRQSGNVSVLAAKMKYENRES